jgi:hypothetical protein
MEGGKDKYEEKDKHEEKDRGMFSNMMHGGGYGYPPQGYGYPPQGYPPPGVPYPAYPPPVAYPPQYGYPPYGGYPHSGYSHGNLMLILKFYMFVFAMFDCLANRFQLPNMTSFSYPCIVYGSESMR